MKKKTPARATRALATAAAALLMLAAACQTEQLADPNAPFAPGQPRPLLIQPVVADGSAATRASNPSAKADGNGTTPVTLTGGDLTLTLSQSAATGAPKQISRYTLTAGTAGTAGTADGKTPAPATLKPADKQPTLFVTDEGSYPLAATSNPSAKADGNGAGADGSAAPPLTATTTQSYTFAPYPGLVKDDPTTATATTLNPLPFGLHAQHPAALVTVAANGTTSLPLTISSAGLMLRMKYKANMRLNPGETFITIAAVRNLITGEKAPRINDTEAGETANTPSRVVETIITNAEGNRPSIAIDTEGNATDYVLFGTLAADTRIDAGTPIAEITVWVNTLIAGGGTTDETKVFTLLMPSDATPVAGQLLSYTVYVDPIMASIEGDVAISDFVPAFGDNTAQDIVAGTAGDGTKPLNPDEFNDQKPNWIVYGGGDAKADALVIQNVNDALASLPNGSISLTLENVTTLKEDAFYFCTALNSIDLPAATNIGKNAFNNCTALATVDLPAATTVGYGAFNKCEALTTVELPAAITVGIGAFAECTVLNSIDLPAATNIGQQAFQDCAALNTVHLPVATSIGQQAFYSCKALTAVDLPLAITVGIGAFQSCNTLTTITLPAAKTIVDFAFDGCTALTTLDVSAVENVEMLAFNGCTALTHIDLKAAKSIGNSAFMGCTALTSITLPEATTIVDYAFQSCTALTTIDLPAATTIGNGAFGYCPAITTVKLPKANIEINIFAANKANIVTLDLSGLTDIGSNAFQGYTALTTITLKGATTIGMDAFNGCDALTTALLPAATTIGNGAFGYCKALTTLDVSAVTSIGPKAFYNCIKLTSLSLTAPGEFTVAGDAFNATEATPSEACALTLNADKKADATGTGSPKVSGNKWAGFQWKSITHTAAAPTNN